MDSLIERSFAGAFGRVKKGHGMSSVFSVPFAASLFPSYVSPKGVLTFSDDELAHALFVTGRAPGDQTSHGMASVWEFIHRSSVIPAYLRRDMTGAVRKSALAQELDRSEKVGLSYTMGQAMTTIFCRRQVGVDFMMHVDRYALRYNLDFGKSTRRPDLFGRVLSTGDWVVAESKGRSNGMEAALPAKLQSQKKAIKSIGGQAPSLCLGCVSSFPVLGPNYWGPMRVDAFDPEPPAEGINMAVIDGNFFRAYYEPFVAAIEFGERDDDSGDYVVASLGTTGVRVGLLRQIFEFMTQAKGVDGFSLDLLRQGEQPALNYEETPFPDGTLVGARWREALALTDYER